MKQRQYEHLSHTADLKVRAYGKTLEEAFANTAKGGFDFLTDTALIKKKEKHKITIKAKRLESLLYDFLEELLFLLDTKGFIANSFSGFAIKKNNMKTGKKQKQEEEFSLSCTALGDSYKNYEVKGDIKAITYSEMKIEKTTDRFVIVVVFDI